MTVKKETTLKSILSALWNLSSHCSENKAEICAVDGALQFLVSLLTYKSNSKTLSIVENGGGILRNVSSQIAIREDYRKILRKHGCLQILLNHLRSTSLTIVSNACGTLWNLSARCEEDQNALHDMGAVSMLKNLVHSRHKMISSGSSAALRNLMSSMNSSKGSEGDECANSSSKPTLHIRKQKAFEADIEKNLSESCEKTDSLRNGLGDSSHRSESEPRRFQYHLNMSSSDHVTSSSVPPTHRIFDKKDEDPRRHLTRRPMMPRAGTEANKPKPHSPQRVPRAGSQDSVGSTHSDISHDRTRAHTMLAKSSHLLHKRQGGSLERRDGSPHGNNSHVHYDPSVNVTPAHGRQGNGSMHPSVAMPLHQYQQQQQQMRRQQQQQQNGQQSQPNSLIVQYMQEVAMYAGVDPSPASSSSPSYMHKASPSSSLQSSQHHQQQMQQQPQRSLLERLTKSSIAMGGAGNMNSSMTLSNTNSNMDSSRLDPSNLPSIEDGDDQPVNYSLKYQDGVDTSSKIPLLHNYNNPSLYNSGFNQSPHLSDGLHYPMNSTEQLMHHTSSLVDSPFNRNSNAGGSMIRNPSLYTPTRPVPNLMYNHFQSPQSFKANNSQTFPMQQPGNMSWQHPAHVRYPHPNHFNSPHSSNFPQMPSHQQNFSQSNHTQNNYRFSSPAGPPKRYHMPFAHQNLTNSAHNNLSNVTNSAYAETDLDSVIDQPTDFSLLYSEEDDTISRDGYQEQPINYSLRFTSASDTQPTSSGTGVAFPNMEELRRFEDERHCVECKYQQEVGDSSNDDQVRTFCTEGTPYLSTATSLTDLRNAGKIEEEEDQGKVNETHSENSGDNCDGHENAKGGGENDEEDGFGFALNSSKNMTVLETADKTLTSTDITPTPVKIDAINTEFAPSSSGSQVTDRLTGSTVVGIQNPVQGECSDLMYYKDFFIHLIYVVIKML